MKVNIPRLLYWNQIMFSNTEQNRQYCYAFGLCDEEDLKRFDHYAKDDPYLFISETSDEDFELNGCFCVCEFGKIDSKDLLIPDQLVVPLVSYLQLTNPTLNETAQFLEQLLNP